VPTALGGVVAALGAAAAATQLGRRVELGGVVAGQGGGDLGMHVDLQSKGMFHNISFERLVVNGSGALTSRFLAHSQGRSRRKRECIAELVSQ